MSLINNLNWRYAAKDMTGESVIEEKLNYILEATNLSASSFGLQPYTVVVVSNKEVKQQLQAAAYGQVQVGNSSHVLVFCVPIQITEANVQNFINHVASVRSIPVNVLDGYKDMILGLTNSFTLEQQQNWAAKQAYLALGTALAAAAEQKIDACPMEGFDAAQFDKILGLEVLGLKPVVIMPIGFRAENDVTAHFIKVRKPKEIMFHFVK